MKLLVKKFGGTSVKDLKSIKKVASLIQKDVSAGYKIVVVVSAMGSFTDDIISQIHHISSLKTLKSLAEYDVVVSSGEQISCGLLSLALHDIDITSQSWLGWQIPIFTTYSHSRARIEKITIQNLLSSFQTNDVAVVAGFQGIHNYRITTLGRGGSDTSAVSLAAALKLNYCEIYTDVDGIYTCDPNIIPKAQKINHISYDEMLEMSSLGAEVLHVRSVEIAKKYNITLRILSTFNKNEGTLISNNGQKMENQLITGIALSDDEASITVQNIKNPKGISSVFRPIALENINVDMIIQSMDSNIQNITFTVKEFNVQETEQLLLENKDDILYSSLAVNSNVAKISIIGVGMISNSGIAHKMFQILTDHDIKILAITTSEIKISILVERSDSMKAAKYLHQGFGLDTNESLVQ